MNNIDFQNGFALGMATGGVVEVEIPAKEEQEKTITITENGTTEILPDTDKALSKVTVVTNVSSGGGTSLNIAYGETAPEDTSKLWVKANEPANVSVGSDIEGVESIASVGAYLPTAVYGMGCARVGTKIYLFGGYGNTSKTINVFDTETETITTLSTTLPSTVGGMGCASVGTKIYMFGGYRDGYRSDIQVFDTETETIAELSTRLPNGMRDMGCASVGTKIYLFGGDSGTYRNTINVFDTETETITTLLTTLPTACRSTGCASVGTKIYLFGGLNSNNTKRDTINVFDSETETITTLTTTLPTACRGMGCARVGTKVYLLGGYGNSALNTINVFDTERETITTLSTTLPTPCDSMGCVSVGTNIYLYGGYGSSALNTINCFTLTHELAQGNLEIQSGLLKNKFNIINTDTAQIEIGVENVYIGNSNNEAETANAFLFVDGEWKQISYGRDQFAPEEPTGTYSERMYNHYGIDKTEYPYLLIRTHSTNSRIEFFKERILENSSYFFRGYRYADVNVAEGSDIETIVASHEASDSSKLSVDTGITTSSSEIADFTYYANFNYAELGYSGVGTWITIE